MVGDFLVMIIDQHDDEMLPWDPKVSFFSMVLPIINLQLFSATSCIDEEESVPQEPKGLCILPSRNSIYSTVYDDPRLFNANVKR